MVLKEFLRGKFLDLADVCLGIFTQQDAQGIFTGEEREARGLGRAINRPVESGLNPIQQHADMIGMRMGQEQPFDLVGLAARGEVLRMSRFLQNVTPMG